METQFNRAALDFLRQRLPDWSHALRRINHLVFLA
jgi:hypothetical protein